MRPKSLIVRLTSASSCVPSVTSVGTASAWRPSFLISSATLNRRVAPRAASTTLAPASESSIAVARPMPLEAPVTIATCP